MTPVERMRQYVSAWSIRYPHLQVRLEKALALTGGVVPQGRGVYRVQGGGGEYVVRVDHEKGTSTCTCVDSHKGHHCKHRLATALVYVVENESKKD